MERTKVFEDVFETLMYSKLEESIPRLLFCEITKLPLFEVFSPHR